MPTIYISDGHSPQAEGACYNSTCEWEFSDSITDKLYGFKDIVIVPDGTLAEKVKWINQRITPGDFALDLHLDLSKGAKIFTHPRADQKLSNKIIKHYCEFIGIQNKGSMPDYMSQHNSLYFCQWVKNKSGFVFELGSIRDKEEFKRIQDFAYGALLHVYGKFSPKAEKTLLRKKLGLIRNALNNETEPNKKNRIKAKFDYLFKKLVKLLQG